MEKQLRGNKDGIVNPRNSFYNSSCNYYVVMM